ncbi:hypothetical protein MLD52_18280 [Puniceicoccaceae bacterium K14]|nr:hypothetical protein [Puniceicoccaceae bacterium K14]
MPPDHDELDELLDAWKVPFQRDEELLQRTSKRVRSESAHLDISSNKLVFLLSRPLYASLAAAALVVLGVFLANVTGPRNTSSENQSIASYRSMIDPVYRLKRGAPYSKEVNLSESTITWLKDELHLSKKQYIAIESLHNSHQPLFYTLYRELESLEHGYTAFDASRKNDDVIDFIALFELLQKQKEIRQQSIEETIHLINEMYQLLSLEQQKAFEKIINTDNTSTPISEYEI